MDISAEELRAFLDRGKIRDCVARLARGEDRCDAELISASFWPGGDDRSRCVRGLLRGIPRVGYARLTGDSGEAACLGAERFDVRTDTALVETHMTSYHRVTVGDEDRDTVIGGRYLDWLERRCDERRIAQHTMLYDWYEDFGESVDWSQGVMGMPLCAGHYTGKAVDDRSETFFGSDAEWDR